MLQSFTDGVTRLGLGMRLLSLAIWAPGVYLTYRLVSEFTEGQSEIIMGAAMLALLVSSIALLISRNSYRRGDKSYGRAALAMYAVAVIVMAFFETGFWSSSISTTQQRLGRAEHAREGVEILRDRQREAMRTGKISVSSEEIKSKMDMQLAQGVGNQPLGRVTANCSDTSSAAYRLCADFLQLKAEYARALKAEGLEKSIWENGTSVETSEMKRNIFAGADAFAEFSGVSTGKAWGAAFSVLIVLLLTVTRDLALLGVFAPLAPAVVRAPSAPVRSEDEEPQQIEMQRTSVRISIPREPALSEESKRDLAARIAEPAVAEAKPAPEPKKTPPTGGGGGGPKRTSAADKVASEPAGDARGKNVVDLPVAGDMFEEPRRRERSERLAQGRAVAWIDERTERVQDLRVACSFEDAWADYRAWCDEENLKTLPKSRFLRAVRSRMSTSSHGFIGLVLCAEVPQKQRAWA